MKKISKFFILLLLPCCLLTGCNKISKNNINFNNVDTNFDIPESIKKLEVLNIYNDVELFVDLREKTDLELEKIDNNYPEDKRLEKANAVLNDYAFGLYKLAVSRVSSDIDTIYTNTDKYMSYIAMLQLYVDTYAEEKELFSKYVLNGDEALYELDSYKMYVTVEDFYLSIIDEELNSN